MLVRLFRDSFETPWGFRLQGGRDLNQELVVQRVFSNSPAEGELQRGDVILAINGRDASTLTHKQAQDSIKFGGGQVELLVSRPPSGASVKPLQPQSPTKAPPLPHKTASIQIPIRRSSDHGPKIMPPPAVAGHQPKKITMNKFGGGTTSFGQSFAGQAKPPGWSPQPSIYSQQFTPQLSMQEQQGFSPQQQSPLQQQYQQYKPPPQQQQYRPPQQQYQSPPQQQYQPPPQQQYQPPPQQQYQPPPQQYQPQYQPQQQSPRTPEQAQYQPYSLNQPQKTSSATISPATPTSQYISPGLSQPDYVRADDPVTDEVDYEYVPVSRRRNVFKEKDEKPPQINANGTEDDYYYPNCPVWERRRMFMKDQPRVSRSGKRRSYGSPAGGATQYGTDYSKGPTPAAVTVQQRPRPPPVTQVPVNAAPVQVSVQSTSRDEPDTSSFSRNWSGTLKSSGGPRPWEQEQKEYVMPSMREPDQPSRRPAPAVSPKPSRSPQPRKPAPSPQQQQIVVRTSSTVSPQAKQGEYHTMFVVDDSDEYLYKLLSEHKHLIGKTVEKNMAPKEGPITQYVPIAQVPVQHQPQQVESTHQNKPRYSTVKPPVRVTPVEKAPPPSVPAKPVTKPVASPKPPESNTSVVQNSSQSANTTRLPSEQQKREDQAKLQVNETPPGSNEGPPNVHTDSATKNDQSVEKVKDKSSVSSNIDGVIEKNVDQATDIIKPDQNIEGSVILSLNDEKPQNITDNISESVEIKQDDTSTSDNQNSKAESAPAILDESLKDNSKPPEESKLNETVSEDSNKADTPSLNESSMTETIENNVKNEVLSEEKKEITNEDSGKDLKTENIGSEDKESVEKVEEQHTVQDEKELSDEIKDTVEGKVEVVGNVESKDQTQDVTVDVKVEEQSVQEENTQIEGESEEHVEAVIELNEESPEPVPEVEEVVKEGKTDRQEVEVDSEEVVIELKSDENQEPASKDEELVKADGNRKEEQTEPAGDAPSEKSEETQEQQPDKTPIEEVKDQQQPTAQAEGSEDKQPQETTADQQEKSEDVDTEKDTAQEDAEKSATQSEETEESEPKAPKKERMDLSQFKQEKKPPGKLNMDKWT